MTSYFFLKNCKIFLKNDNFSEVQQTFFPVQNQCKREAKESTHEKDKNGYV